MEPVAYLNGTFLPLAEAKVSVLDRGFLFGDGVYEVVPVYRGRPFCFDRHLSRLEQSLRAVEIEPPLSREAWWEIAKRVIPKGVDCALYLQVTRGCDPTRNHVGGGGRPTVVAFPQPLPKREETTTAILLEDIRWPWGYIKSTSLLANVLLKRMAQAAGAGEALLFRDGFLTEGAASNVFLVYRNQILTPPRSPYLLPGITRDLLVEVGRARGWPICERPIPIPLLQRAEEIWITSSTREVVAVVALDGRKVGEGRPGPLFHHFRELFREFKEERLRGEGG